MIPRLKRDDDAVPVGRSTDLVDGWLRVFLSLLKLPQAQAASIREELEGHLRERVRDLMVSGVAEGEATRQAISELGEAADVAARYRALHAEPRRRLIMHATLFTAAGAALALSIAAFRGGQPPQPAPGADDRAAETRKLLTDVLSSADPGSRRMVLDDLLTKIEPLVLQSAQPDRDLLLNIVRRGRDAAASPGATAYSPEPLPAELAVLKIDWALKESAASDAFEFLGKAATLPLHVRWNLLQDSGLKPGTPITMNVKQAGVGAFMRALNEACGAAEGAAAELRVADGVLEVATREYFDRREIQLVSYDLSGIIAARMATYNEAREPVVKEICEAIVQFVSSADWKETGGGLAEMSVVGDRLFVKAPARLHPQIRWILGQLPSRAEGEAPHLGDAPAAVPVTRVYALKHAAALGVLHALEGLESIKAIDFSKFAADPRNNSIMARATPEQQKCIQVALDSLDRPTEATKP